MIPNWLNQRAAVSPDRLAVIAGSERWTFRELDERATQAARRLAALGVRPGGRVALLMRNGARFALLAHAASKIGAALVPLNIRLAAPELVWQLGDVSAAYLLYDEANEQLALAAARDLPALTLADALAFDQLPETDCALQEEFDLNTVYGIIYTSGTTGRPKGAMLTYGNFWWSAIASALNLGLRDDDCWLACLPLFHVGGLSILLRSVIYGAPAIIHERFDAEAVNRAIDEQAVTIIPVVSAMLQKMIDQHGAYPPSLRCVLLGGGPAPRPLLEACAERGIPVSQTYGLTETCSQFATLPPQDALRKLGSVGKPLMPNQLRIERAEHESAVAKPDDIGEIVVRGPTVTAGYVNRPDTTAAVIRDGWLHTGDLGYVDGDGYLYVVARRDDLIVSGGENVYPAEIEAVLLAHPDIEEAGVTGVSDPRWGQVPLAAIKLRRGATLSVDDLRAFCDQRLARYKIPAHIWFVEALPRNAAGKLLRGVLADDWRRHNAKQV